jgi:hypothetical protein
MKSMALGILSDIAGAVRLGVLNKRMKKFEKKLEKRPEDKLYYTAQIRRIQKTLKEVSND